MTTSAAFLALLASPALAAPQANAPSPHMTPAAAPQVWSQTHATGREVCVRTMADPGTQVILVSGQNLTIGRKPGSDRSLGQGLPTILGIWRADSFGRANFELPVIEPGQLPGNFTSDFHVVRTVGGSIEVDPVALPLAGPTVSACQTFDPNELLGDDESPAGLMIASQWDDVGMEISGVGNLSPDAVIIFDSGNPTGNDLDLATPGPGFNNTVALGDVLILPTNVDDADGDGLVDDPCDAAFGGVITMDFDAPYRMCGATILDIDDGDVSELRFYTGSAMTLQTIPLQDLGDNSVQELVFDIRDVRRFEVSLSGSGAIARVEMVPCAVTLDFDQTAFGTPRNLPAGLDITSQFADIGVSVSADNNVPGHPDKLILFDSANPTGEDFDLMTPGPGLNNTVPLNLVGIIAEDDVDLDGDGLVDDPDDEEMGGVMMFDFTEDVEFLSATLLDVDGVRQEVFTFFDASGAVLDVIQIDALGDNSVQQLLPAAPIVGVRRIEVNLIGSGAIDRLRWCPMSNR